MRVTPGVLRLERLVVTRGAILSILLAVLAVAAITGAAVSATDPPTEVVTHHEHEQTVETGVQTRAPVTGESDMYRRGETLDDMPVYLLGASPNLTVISETRGPPNSSTRVEQRVSLVYRATRDGEVFWERSHPVARSDGSTGDGPVTTSGTIDVESVRSEVRRLQSELGGAGTVSVAIVVEVTYDTGRYRGELSGRTPLHVSDRAYWLGGDASWSETHTTPAHRERVDPERVDVLDLPGDRRLTVPTTAVVLLGGGLASLLAAVLVGVYYRRGPRPAVLDERLHEARYAEWISTGRLPAEFDRQSVEVDTLEDLVDVGIDTANRTIHDPADDRYAVLDESVVYYYGGDSTPADGSARSGDAHRSGRDARDGNDSEDGKDYEDDTEDGENCN